MSIKPVLYFPRDLSYTWKAMVHNGPSQQHKRRFEASTHRTTQSIGWFLGGGQMGLTIPSGFAFHLFIVCSFNSQRVAFVAYHLSELKATDIPKDSETLLGMTGEGTMTASSAILSSPHPYTCLSCPGGVSSQHDPNSGSSDQPGEWTDEHRTLQKVRLYSDFLKNGNFLLTGQIALKEIP